jgi:hypothetical protein
MAWVRSTVRFEAGFGLLALTAIGRQRQPSLHFIIHARFPPRLLGHSVKTTCQFAANPIASDETTGFAANPVPNRPAWP